jgi:hypothetical protein
VGPNFPRSQKETAQSLLPTAISLLSASKGTVGTIVENVDKIQIIDLRGFLLLERHQ